MSNTWKNENLMQITLENTEGVASNGKSRDSGNIDEAKQNKNITQYVRDTTMHNQIQLT